MGHILKTSLRASAVACVIAAALVVGALSQPAGASSGGAAYGKNTSGLTFGSALKASSPDAEPDLILVVATNGRDGYVVKKELDDAAGSNVSSPSEALAWQARAGGTNDTLTVYESDGKTKIGQFVLHHATAAERAAAPGAPGK